METSWAQERYRFKGQVLLLKLLFFSGLSSVSGQIRYSISEEMEKGSVLGNIVNDLGLDISELSARGLRIVSQAKKHYFDVNVVNGNLLINENIDRENICRNIPRCLLTFEILVENPLTLYGAEVEIQDINDNSPRFLKQDSTLEISEATEIGKRFSFENAEDADIGINSLQSYRLSPNKYFTLDIRTNSEGKKYAELVLEKPLDREEVPVHILTLTAVDGGTPTRSGTVNIQVTVLDANDNAPLFIKEEYKASLQENALNGTVVIQVNATDVDEGSYGEVTYSFRKISERALKIFKVDSKTGVIKVTGIVDYEEEIFYEMEIRAKDGGGMTGYCKVILQIIDVNDNPPLITVTSFTTPIPENSLPGTVTALLNIYDHDSGENGKVVCFISENLPFTLKPSLNNYYTLVTNRILDREQVSEYNIIITARDKGVPPLTTSKSVLLKISDINDNSPIFNQTSYTAYVNENNPPGSFICSVKATDLDCDMNASLTYSITETQIHGKPVSSYISINPENGNIQALRSFDHEQFRDFYIQVKVQDAGFPPLSSSVTVNVFVLDQNDNAPEILYPSRRDGASIIELAPHSAEAGYLVTKVVAVDADSGQNAWLSYSVVKITEPKSFHVGLHTGEVRTTRLFQEKEAVRQTLVILVKDNGQPSLSTTVAVNILVADKFQEILPDLDRLSANTDYSSNITLYLVIALASVSFLFLCFIILLLIIKIRRWRSSKLFHSLNVRTNPNFPPCYADVGGLRSLPKTYSYQEYLTRSSSKSEFKYINGCSENISADPNCTELQRQELSNPSKVQNPFNQIPPNTDWRFSQGQRPGTSGSQPPTDEIAAWPSNQMDSERLQNMMAAAAAANEPSDGGSTMGAGTLGLSTRYGPQFTLQHVPDYRQNVYIPGSMSSLSNAGQQGGKKKKSGKKDKK
nr:PREDICTED: protocadherin gamma-A5 isoform X6 [Latimeria chalumnae]|eukprot:XP_014343523.1 PREDICTED: protocadherin gamma-A5 isoform X6 [Latimeria chalumnae]